MKEKLIDRLAELLLKAEAIKHDIEQLASANKEIYDNVNMWHARDSMHQATFGLKEAIKSL